MKIKNKGLYLKEVSFDFLLGDTVISEVLNIETAQKFLFELINILKTEVISVSINPLPPGFDILIGIKESCVYLGYWAEKDYVHLIVSSCKNFNEKEISSFIKTRFGNKPQVTVVRDTTVTKLIKNLELRDG